MQENLTHQPLKNLRVLDFSKILAGPLCTQYLANMGADVIKVEPIEAGDDTRAWPPFVEPGVGAVYLSTNRGKRSIAINLKTDGGQRLVARLATGVDVVIESFGAGVAERLKIDEASLRAVNPALIYCSISGFGRNGPMRDAPGYDVILQAFCGVMALTGDEGGSYMRSPISPIDQMTGMHALTGILAALHERGRSGRGIRVDANLFDTAIGLMGYNLVSTQLRGVAPPRAGSGHEALCPYQAFAAADGPVMIGVANDALWRRFCVIAGMEDLAEDPRFATNPDRAANRAETVALVQAAIARHPVDWWVRELTAQRVPCAPINSVEQLLATPQISASGMLAATPVEGKVWHGIAQPVRFDNVRGDNGRRAPRHGEHGHEILTDFGLSDPEIADLRQQAVITLP